jgi:murein DD-endopeptidase MepM/ murein hydrolase activator NlpD
MTLRRATRFVAILIALSVLFFGPAAFAGDGTAPGDPPPTEEPTDPPASEEPANPPASEDPADPPTSDEPASEDPAPEDSGEGTTEGESPEDEEIEFDPTDPEQVFREIVFPVVGASSFTKGFGDCRDGCTRLHNGIDILTFGWKGVPVVASHDGRIILTRTGGELSGCAVVIKASDGWTSHYSHLNTDLAGTDVEDDLCFAPGIEVGASVSAGTIIGWVGDSGNAEESPPHVHFEIRNPDGIPVDAWVSLASAHRIEYRLIDSLDLVEIASALFGEDTTTAFVVEVGDMLDAAQAPTSSDSPIVPFDPMDPAPALGALRAMALERIIVFTDDTEPTYIDDLRALAPVVEIAHLPAPAEPEPDDHDSDEATGDNAEATDEAHAEPVTLYEAVKSSTIIVVAGKDAKSLDAIVDQHDQVFAFASSERLPADLGSQKGSQRGSHPGADANREAFWWPSADGWLLTDTIPERGDLSIVLVSDLHDEAVLSYVKSQAVAPPVPLWHHQPTSRTTKSL